MDIAAWLRSLGLERYASAFRDNEIDATVLPKLTAEAACCMDIVKANQWVKMRVTRI